ncbi:MAG: hypothetical protein PHU25_01770 [Deltaproteobacteria bacterium]|nr:hypothetical protein [Deltaproteobacteria bacterium]
MDKVGHVSFVGEVKTGAATGPAALRATLNVASNVPPVRSLTKVVTVPAVFGVQLSDRLVEEPVVVVDEVQFGMKSASVLGRLFPVTVNVVLVPTIAVNGDNEATAIRSTSYVASSVPPGISLTNAVTVPAARGVHVKLRLVDVPVVAVSTVQLGIKRARVLGSPAPVTVKVVAVPTAATNGERPDIVTVVKLNVADQLPPCPVVVLPALTCQ